MLAIQSNQHKSQKCIPNILPCRINHDGAVNACQRYWAPKDDTGRASDLSPGPYADDKLRKDGKPLVYFRGRKLCGRVVKIPNGYRGWCGDHCLEIRINLSQYAGVVVNRTNRLLPAKRKESGLVADSRMAEVDGDEDNSEGEREPVKILEESAEFDELVAWAHETTPEMDDIFVKGIEEWITFAEAMHSTESGIGDDITLKDPKSGS